MTRWNLILRVMLAEYLGLRPDATAVVPHPETRDEKTNHSELVSGGLCLPSE